MPVKFYCKCGTALIVSRRRIGSSISCPKCERRIEVPKPKKRQPAESDASVRDKRPAPPLRPPEARHPAADAQDHAPPPIQTPPPTTQRPPPLPHESIQAKFPVDEPAPALLPLGPVEMRSSARQQPAEDTEPPAEEANEASWNETPAAETVPTQGYEPDHGKVSTVRLLAASLALTAICSMIPAVLDIIEHVRVQPSAGVARWAYLLLLVGTVQLAYALYLAQLPDWSTVWVVTVVSLVLASVYAGFLSLTILAGSDSGVIASLELTDQLRGGRATGWCFIMLCVSCLLSYTSGRISVRWQKKRR